MPDSTRQAAPLALVGRYLFPATGEPIAGGAVTILGERIVAVGRPAPGAKVRDLGNVAILPGLINAHTHLELSENESHLPLSFVDWLRSVVALRRAGEADAAAAVRRGVEECLRSGTTAIGEIAQPGWSAQPFDESRLDATVFLELIGPTPEWAQAAIELAEKHLAAAGRSDPVCSDRIHAVDSAAGQCWRPGLSPHAPYSVRPELLAAAVRLAHERRVPLAFHLAESREELELLERGTGPLREFLAELGAWSPDAFRPGTRPLDLLRILSDADRALVIHGNYLDGDEIAFLASHADRMAVVYCPRTHARFGHDAYPLAEMLRAGVTVALGTDSRASAPDLSLLAEIRFVARAYPQLARGVVLRLGTIDAAWALGRAHDLGSIEPGKAADLAIVPLNDPSAGPYELLFDSDHPVAATWHLGQPVHIPG